MDYVTVLARCTTSNGVTVGDTIDVSEDLDTKLFVKAVRYGSSVSGSTQIRIESSPIDGIWFPVYNIDLGQPLPYSTFVVSFSHGSGVTNINAGIYETANPPAGTVFLKNIDVTADLTGEWGTAVRVIGNPPLSFFSFGSNTIYLEDPTTSAYAAGARIYTGAYSQIFSPRTLSITKFRIVVDGSQSVGANTIVESYLTK